MVIALQNGGLELAGVRWEIDACDLNPERIAQARRGSYEAGSLRACDDETRRRYFREVGGRYELRERYRKGVRFFEANLLAPNGMFGWGTYDAIFCRNMLIYFGEEAFDQVIGLFARSLAPGRIPAPRPLRIAARPAERLPAGLVRERGGLPQGNSRLMIRVFVVDDSAFVRRALARILGAQPGFQVVGEAANGLEALERVPQADPDLVTLDVAMPGIDGIQVLRGLLRWKPGLKVHHAVGAYPPGRRGDGRGAGGRGGGVHRQVQLQRDGPGDAASRGAGEDPGLFRPGGARSRSAAPDTVPDRSRGRLPLRPVRHRGVDRWTRRPPADPGAAPFVVPVADRRGAAHAGGIHPAVRPAARHALPAGRGGGRRGRAVVARTGADRAGGAAPADHPEPVPPSAMPIRATRSTSRASTSR